MPLIVIEGVDCSGKETQTERLVKRLAEEGKNAERITFPNYESESSGAVKMYLRGDLGKNAYDVNPYAASVLFAADRFASFKSSHGWGIEEKVVVADRYVTSNMVHQASKIESEEEKRKYIAWLRDLEYGKLGLPKPDLVIFLDMPPEMSLRLNEERKNKITGKDAKDIHEGNIDYLRQSYNNAHFVASEECWRVIKCAAGERLKTIDEIAEEIFAAVREILYA